MPIYEFKCDRCEKVEQIKLNLSDPKELICGDCGTYMWRVWFPISTHFKGKGWGKDK